MILEHYFYANDIDDEKKQIAVLLTVIGSETYSLLQNLLSQERPYTKSFVDIVNVLKHHLNPKPIVIAERDKFYERKQHGDEKLSDYIAQLRKLTEHCEFDNFLEQALRDKFVCGLYNTNLRKRLIAERNLTLQKALEISISLEEAEKESEKMQQTILKPSTSIQDNFYISRRPAQQQQQYQQQINHKCYRCHGADHLLNTCRYKSLTCNKCGFKGHFKGYLYGRHFMLTTDNKALSRIIHPNTDIPNISAARLVRWSVILAAYDYEIELKPTQKHLNADMLSRLPVCAASNNYLPNSINTMQIGFLPITAQKIRLATRVIRYLSQDMWPSDISSDLKPYFDKRLELSLENGILLWGLRVVIPERFKLDIMNELHDQDPGIVRMKALSRIHVWFLNIDKAIEEKVNTCNDCKKVSRNPPKTFIHPWNWPTQPFHRVNIDFVGPFYGKNNLLLVDSYSKWMEVDIVPVTNSFKTIEILRRWFSQFGLPYQN